MRSLGRIRLWAATPLVVGAVVGLTWWVADPRTLLVLRFSPALLAVAVGAVVGGVVLLAARRGSRRRRWAERLEAHDLRVRHEAEASVRQERVRLLGRLDHELKNPLMAIRLGLSSLREAPPASAEHDRAVEVVESQAGRLTSLLADLRKVADLESRSLDLEQVDLAALLHDVRTVVGATPDGAHRLWRVEVPSAPWPVPTLQADPDLLFLALHNLADNAVKYTRPGDRVELRVSDEGGDEVLVQVADTGAGIPSDEVGAVWEELARASTSRGVPGTGLGLPLVRAVARRHGGRVDLRSRVGEGTAVRIWLPVGGPRQQEATP